MRVEREGEPPRSFALKRAPELRGLLTGFSALLTGDAPGLKRSFDVQAQGSDESWTLQLTPLDSRARRRLQKIEITRARRDAALLLAAQRRRRRQRDGAGRRLPASVAEERNPGIAQGTLPRARRLKRTPRALLLLAAWVIALAILGWFVQRQLVVGADLRLFLPSPTTPEQRLLLEEVGEGPASRVLAIALDGAPPEQLADISRELVAALQDSREFRLVTNGEFTLDSVPDELLPYRFLLSPTVDTQRFDAQYLHAELLARARDLASPAGSFLEPWLPRDPTLEMLKLLQRWQPMQEPRREYDVWFDRSGRRALLIAETQAPAFDPDRQRAALQELERALARQRTARR